MDVERRGAMIAPVKCTAAELEALQAFARERGLSLADLVRSALAAYTGVECGPRINRARPRGYRMKTPDLRRRW